MSDSIIIGIDFSMTSPALTIHRGDTWDLKNCRFFFLTTKNKYITLKHPFCSNLIEPYTCDQERYQKLARQTQECFSMTRPDHIYLEGYSFGSKGNTFNIGEATGELKMRLFDIYGPNKFEVIPPTVIKKFASGKGNSNKELMYVAFLTETKWNIEKDLLCSIGKSPLSDVIDSYYIAKYGFYKYHNLL